MARLEAPVMKTSRRAPAASASSTAYWMSGLSTTGSISLGLALVAGRNRVPRPATGNTAVRITDFIRRSLTRSIDQSILKSTCGLISALGPFENNRMQRVPRAAFGATPIPADARQAAIVALIAPADITHAHQQGTQRGDLARGCRQLLHRHRGR